MTDITENAALQPAESAAPPPRRRGLVKRLLPLGMIAAGMAAAFALGRQLEYYDEPAIRRIVAALREDDRFQTLVKAIEERAAEKERGMSQAAS